ncbi:MAG: elongation factor G, partial [Candidatus Aerophobetes bacterium]|nr:elongation factor G [Candidatus Aerophobetes bacterium]
KGVEEAMQTGVLRGYPMVNVKVSLIDGSSHPVDSSEFAFKTAASIAFKKAARQANPCLLEPIMREEVKFPQDFVGEVMGDIVSRRGRIYRMETKADIYYIGAYVPLVELFGYVTRLRSLTKGKAVPNIEFSHYTEVPSSIVEELAA